MASDGFTTVRIRNSTIERLRVIAEKGYRSLGSQIDLLVNNEYLQVVSVTKLPFAEAHGQDIPLALVKQLNEQDVTERQP